MTLNTPSMAPYMEKWGELAPAGRMGKPEELPAVSQVGQKHYIFGLS